MIEKPYKDYLVTRVETVKVSARSEDEALFKGEQTLDFFGSETSNIEAEELEVSILKLLPEVLPEEF